MKNPSVPRSDQEPLSIARSCTSTLHPAGAIGVFMKSKWPRTAVNDDINGLSFDGRIMLSVSSVCWTRRSQQSLGNDSSAMLRMLMKWALTSCIARSAGF